MPTPQEENCFLTYNLNAEQLTLNEVLELPSSRHNDSCGVSPLPMRSTHFTRD